MRKIGLKLWSPNTDYYLKEAQKLYEEGVFDYIELYVVPDTLETLEQWKKLDIPFIIHNAHFVHGFNLAKRENEQRNLDIYNQTVQFANALQADKIIFHGGVDGDPEETARQLKNLHEPRALLENKPYIALPNRMGGNFCRGATLDELRNIIEYAECGFCFDIGHAICSAASQKRDAYDYLRAMLALKPAMFHLSDVSDMASPYDSHLHLGSGQLNLKHILEIMDEDAIISLETDKDSREHLEDFRKDAAIFREREKMAQLD